MLPEGAERLLLDWFREHRRALPWREDRSFYTVLVSELMLQQTRVEAVKERYTLFLQKFPTPEALAAAEEDEVLKEWEGLGYYSRARNLHAAAKVIAEEGLPTTFEGVRALPGVGDYTAGAICSIALGLREPAVDGNVLRILTRLTGDHRCVDGNGAREYFKEALRADYPPETGEFTEALMELGAIVCLPNGAPLCEICPWNTLCRAHSEGRELEFPVRAPKRERKVVEAAVYVYRRENRYGIVRRGEGLLAGLYGFPMKEGGTMPASGVLEIKRAKHIFTHVEWHMTGYLIETEEEDAGGLKLIWATAEEIKEQYAIPSAFKAFLGWLRP